MHVLQLMIMCTGRFTAAFDVIGTDRICMVHAHVRKCTCARARGRGAGGGRAVLHAYV